VSHPRHSAISLCPRLLWQSADTARKKKKWDRSQKKKFAEEKTKHTPGSIKKKEVIAALHKEGSVQKKIPLLVSIKKKIPLLVSIKILQRVAY
jgi:hypothetical protein